jgi:hypothetical protein
MDTGPKTKEEQVERAQLEEAVGVKQEKELVDGTDYAFLQRVRAT